jgi:uncharacterized oligopeptide transporter (OPT) family protein
MGVRKAVYRNDPTPAGLEAIEKGTLKHFDNEVYSNLNTGVLEEYLEEKNRTRDFGRSSWDWKKIIFGLLIGMGFAIIVEYVGLKVGIAIGGAWYVMYILGLAMRWKSTDVNITTAMASAATHMSTGFIFTFPALYMLIYTKTYWVHGAPLIHEAPSVAVPLVAAMASGFLGTVYFILFRRLWLVEDPLPMPGIEASVKLLDIADHLHAGAAESTKRSVKQMVIWTLATMGFVLLRDFPVETEKLASGQVLNRAVLDKAFGGSGFYDAGIIIQPADSAKFSRFGISLEPILLALGWFMRLKIAFLFCAGSILMWLVIIPLAVGFHTPIFLNDYGVYVDVFGFNNAAMQTFSSIGRPLAIGVILGGGLTALVRMAPAFKRVSVDVLAAFKGQESRDYEKGRGWYEWPLQHIFIVAAFTFFVCAIVFTTGGYPVAQSLVFSLVLVITTFFIGAIAVKVMGEVGTEPVSGTSFIVLLALIFLFKAMGTPPETMAIMAILGTTVFGSAIAMSGAITGEFKSALYAGTRPYYLTKAQLWAVIPGAIPSVIGAVVLSIALAKGEINLPAPQANAFATLVVILIGGQTSAQLGQLIIAGIAIGCFIDLLTGMGTAFGLGMYLPIWSTLPALVGGIMREVWQKRVLVDQGGREKWDEQTKTLKLLGTYMAATGLLIGASLMGTIVAIYMVARG